MNYETVSLDRYPHGGERFVFVYRLAGEAASQSIAELATTPILVLAFVA